LLHRGYQALQALLAGEQGPAVLLQGILQIIPRLVQPGLDLIQAQPQLAQEQDLLQAQQVTLPVQAVAVVRVPRRREQANLVIVVVIVVQGARADPGDRLGVRIELPYDRLSPILQQRHL
jgi:hypothetical protein